MIFIILIVLENKKYNTNITFILFIYFYNNKFIKKLIYIGTNKK